MAEVARLTGATTSEGVRLLAPMAPRPAARLEGVGLPSLPDHIDAVADLCACHDVVVGEAWAGFS